MCNAAAMKRFPRQQHYFRTICQRLATSIFCFLLLFVQDIFAESLQAPRFISQPSSSSNIVSEGRTKILQCQALGYPQPVYRWLRNGEPLTEFLSEHFYKIQSTRREDAGSYQCIARNDVGAIFSDKIDVTVAYMGLFEDVSERTVQVIPGGAAILELPPIESHPPPSVTWQTADAPLPYDRKFAVTGQHQLIVLAADEADEKAYRARTTNTQLGKEENSGYIRLQLDRSESVTALFDDDEDQPPVIVVGPADLRVVRGQSSAELQCIANARALHELDTIWLKDGIPLENTGLQYSYNDPWNRTLSLLAADPSHTGRYECRARLRSSWGREQREAVAGASVIVLEKPSFTMSLRPETLGEFGSATTLGCQAVGTPRPNVTWYRNTEPLGVNDTNSRFEVQEDGSLLIKKLLMQDSGMFQCVAANEAGATSTYTWLRVKRNRFVRSSRPKVVRVREFDIKSKSTNYVGSPAAPIMEVPPANITVLDGKDATISCRALGAPTPNTTWLFEDNKIVDQSHRRAQILEFGDLLIPAVRSSDTGRYTCIRANEAGKVEASAWISVLVRTQIIQPPADTRVILGHTATMQCKVSSDDSVPYDVSWSKNKESINPKPGSRIRLLNDGTLEIGEVRAADVGDYTCLVSSPGGNDTRSAKLKVIELPYAPGAVRAYRVPSTKTVNVSWTPGFDGNSPILKYIIQRREVPDTGPIPYPPLSWLTELANVSAGVRWVLLPSLRAAASYQFRVSAVNSVGEGTPSEPSDVVMLPQERPSGPPQGLVGSARSPSEIIIQWQPPLEQHRNGLILGYIVRYRLYGYLDSPWSYRNVTNEAQRNYLIQELITWKDYEVQIAAYNDKGVGIYSDSIKIKTKEGVPEAPPVNVRARAINSTSVQVWWTPPDPQKINGINQGYKLQAWLGTPEDGGIEAKTVNVPPSLLDPLAEQTAIVSDLDKFTEYNLTVLCFTDPGDGDRSIPVEVLTNEDVPGPVASLQFDEVSDRAVKVLWAPPMHANGILIGYTLTYMVREEPRTEKTIELPANTTSLKIERLQATTHYKFEVSARTSMGSGPAKSATIQSGVEPVLPSAPSHLAVTNIEAFSVVLQFTPGFDGNSSITKWIVEAQTARNSTWTVIHEVSDSEATTVLVPKLTPFMQYSLRLLAVNVVGASPPSDPTKDFQTIQAPPEHPPRNVTVRAMSATELRVRWIPLQQLEWFGNPRGYNITCSGPDGKVLSFPIEDHTANSHILSGLEEFAEYHITMVAFNDVGASKPSPAAKERTREAVPSFGPLGVEANATSSTTIVVKWGDVPKEHENGIIEGFKVYYGADARSPFMYKDIPKNSTFTTTLTELRKYVTYHIQVLAYTRLGDGALSVPPVRVQTFEDTPGPPSNVSFPDVSFTTARIIWDVPYDPNGEILAYVVTYHREHNDDGPLNFSREFPPSDRTFRATELQPEQYYVFSVRAQTRLGWGKTAHARVFTTNNRETPQAPSAPQVSRSQVQSEQITFSWTPGRDGFAPLRYYTVQRAEGPGGPWITVPERVDPQLSSYTVIGLIPYTAYRFRIQATNDMGPSGWSPESPLTRTLPAAPSKGVQGLKVVPITTTSVRVQWEPISEPYWSGDHKTGGYRIMFQPVSHYPTALQATPAMQVPGMMTNEAILGDLTRDRTYEVVVVPYNSQGLGPATPPATVYVGEAVPTGRPLDVTAEALSSTEVRLTWRPPPAGQQNGELLGYKIYYIVIGHPAAKSSNEATHIDESEGAELELEVVPAPSTGHSLVFLDQYTRYRIHIVAFNPAGDGPPSNPVTVATLQGLPGPPSNFSFSDITMTSLKVTWDPPVRQNGEILGYVVTYETAEQNDKFSKQVKQKVSGTTSLIVQGLEEEVTYTFWVRAQTLDYGPATTANVTTGPQDGSPSPPRELTLTRTVASIDLAWMNGLSGKGPILGYYLESKRKATAEEWQLYDTRWQTVARTKNGPLQEFSVSYQNLLPSTSYMFRVIAYNRFGVSCPSYTDEDILTPSKLYLEYGYLQHKPFYRQTWFMVALAASSIVIIIAIIAVLCVKSKSFKYKQEAQKTLEETLRMEQDEPNDASMELYNHRPYRTFSQNLLGSMGRNKPRPPAVPMLGKSPPRPSPASVAYHSDEDSVKGYDENPDDSSVTEKPSELSSTDSQATDSDNDSERSAPHSFVNHYANVNDSLRQSWKRQRPTTVRNYSSYTDSEPEPMGASSHPGGAAGASMSAASAVSGASASTLNGGQIVMNNKARSRAPLPGFSSFV